MHIRLPPDAAQAVRQISEECDLSFIAVTRQAIALMKYAHEAGKDGRHLGLTPHRENLETVLVLS